MHRRFAERGDRGSAVVEFVLVVPLLLVVAVGVLQVALALHVRSTLTSAAAEGARAASLAGADPAAGVRRTRVLLDGSLAGGVVRDVSARRAVVDGLPVVEVRIDATLPLIGLLGPTSMSVEGHAVQEGVG
ncbi:MAG: pilus assembly protein [Actinobacteria bacterium]|nr:pilus assembly protein [Actinomycetota bacterium]